MKTYKLKKILPIVVYPGSCIQQNHGESLGRHGYVIWNLKTKKFKQIDIGNNFGFFTIDINHGKLETNITDIPPKVRLRVRCFESIASEVKLVVNEIKKLSEVIEIIYVRVDSDQTSTKTLTKLKDLNLSDLSEVGFQNTLIRSFLEKRHPGGVSVDVLARIFEVNELYNSSIDKEKFSKNIRWKPKKFEFSNMFSYGEDNVVDFSNMTDVIGIFAANASGKSSLLSALSFCIFDKCDRAFKASHVLNSQKMSFHCKFNFEISGVEYFIERNGKSDKKGNVKVDVKFWKEVDGKIVELNGEARRSTNDLIRDYLGSYDDFILTVLSVQNNRSGTFVDMGQTERKDLLSQFMGLNIFDYLYQPSMERQKEIEAELRLLQKKETDSDLSTIENDLFTTESQCGILKRECGEFAGARDSINGEILKITEGLVKLEKDVPTELLPIEVSKNETEAIILNGRNQALSVESSLVILRDNFSETSASIKIYIDDGVESKFEELVDLRTSASNKKHEIDKKKIFVSSKLDKLKKLESHQYDPNCEFCVNNEFVKDALVARDSLGGDKKIVTDLLSEQADINSKISLMSGYELKYSSMNELISKSNTLEKQINQKSKELLTIQNGISSGEIKLKDFDVMIEKYQKQESDIRNNQLINLQRGELTKQLTVITDRWNEKNSSLNVAEREVIRLKIEKERSEETSATMKSLEKDLVAYSMYVTAVGRDGIPFDLISHAVPVIEKEVNLILSQIVEFGVNIQTDGKNVVTNIVYSDKSWPLELASGLEKFLTSLVIRVALINISNLPRPNFIAIDEGFGCADGDNLSSMNSLFSILKSNFDFMLIISHLDSMKDMVDHTIEIKKENGFSKITA